MMADVTERSLRQGDVVLVQAGDLVPADLRLVEARGLEVDEWELTGEIAPVARRVNGSEAVYLYRGSRVTRGSGRGEVTATRLTDLVVLVESARRLQRHMALLGMGRIAALAAITLGWYAWILGNW